MVDYCKAFDMVDHGLLLENLQVYGLSEGSFEWFESYLRDRRQLVKLGDTQSSPAVMHHGIPQGSIIGPLLFILFINDLPFHVTSSRIDLYADDTTLISSTSFKSMDKLQNSLNQSIAEVDGWATSNKLPINESKTKALLITGKRLTQKLEGEMNLTVNGKELELASSV